MVDYCNAIHVSGMRETAVRDRLILNKILSVLIHKTEKDYDNQDAHEYCSVLFGIMTAKNEHSSW